jgi:hypothetical protein
MLPIRSLQSLVHGLATCPLDDFGQTRKFVAVPVHFAKIGCTEPLGAVVAAKQSRYITTYLDPCPDSATKEIPEHRREAGFVRVRYPAGQGGT